MGLIKNVQEILADPERSHEDLKKALTRRFDRLNLSFDLQMTKKVGKRFNEPKIVDPKNLLSKPEKGSLMTFLHQSAFAGHYEITLTVHTA
jgi:hypothetical protein